MRFSWIILLVPILCHALPGYHEPWGKDSDLAYSIPQPPEPKEHSFSVLVAEQIIRFHQNVLSPVDGPRSHFRPSSSAYMLQSMQKHGFFKGYLMGCDRLMRENSDEWVYRKIETEGKLFKYDPVR
jgi:putative component of membrane protein insertase Oxa1/YidC/SpoIIIJ protein YidD